MQNFDDIWNPFSDDTQIAVVCPDPKNMEHANLRLLARKFGQQVPDSYKDGTIFLYGQKSHGSSNHHDHEEDRAAKETGEKYFVPKWLTNLSYAFGAHYQAEIERAYKNGKAHGKSLLQRLASGDMSVLNFDDPRS